MAEIKKYSEPEAQSYILWGELVTNSIIDGSGFIALFHGSPTDTEESWCHDCLPSIREFGDFAKEYEGGLWLYAFSAGTREEFRRTDETGKNANYFVRNPPYLQSIPTAALCYGHPQQLVRLMTVTSPRRKDFLYMADNFSRLRESL